MSLLLYLLSKAVNSSAATPREQALQRGLAFAVATKHHGEAVLRLCFVNPLTSRGDVDVMLDSLT